MASATEPPPEPSSGRAKLRWILGWIVLPLGFVSGLFCFGVHVGARHPDMGLSRFMLWIFDAEPGVRASPDTRTPRQSSPRGIELSGEWVIGNFVVDIQPPAGAVLDFYGRDALFMNIGDMVAADGPVTHINLTAACDGPCDDASLRARIQALPDEDVAMWSGMDARLEWVQRQTELRPNVWWHHYRALDHLDAPIDLIEVTFLDSRAASFLRCEVYVIEPDRARIHELTEYCKTLSWRVADADTPPPEARFAGRYTIDGFELNIAKPPPGFVFHHFELMPRTKVVFHMVGTNSSFAVADCTGGCGPSSWSERSLERYATNRWRGRTEDSAHVEGQIVATRSGTNAVLSCDYHLQQAERSRADEIEAFCVELLAEY
jgi:hypothetical protein